jgi:hypothetical protein
MMKKQKKYKIDEEMNKLNLPNYKTAIRVIPKLLNIAFNTFHNYRKLTLEAKADIPYGIVRKLELLFGMKSGELANFKIECKTLEIIIRDERSNPND